MSDGAATALPEQAPAPAPAPAAELELSRFEDPRPVVFVGMMGSGKSKVGKKVAKKLGRPFLDSDRVIEARVGRTIPDMFAIDGEATFRDVEREVIVELLDHDPAAVIATGGGAVLDPNTRAHLHDRAIVIWLRASPGALAGRVKDDGSRPLLSDDPRGTLFRLSAERDALYQEVAHHVIDVDHVERKLLAKQVLALLIPIDDGAGS